MAFKTFLVNEINGKGSYEWIYWELIKVLSHKIIINSSEFGSNNSNSCRRRIQQGRFSKEEQGIILRIRNMPSANLCSITRKAFLLIFSLKSCPIKTFGNSSTEFLSFHWTLFFNTFFNFTRFWCPSAYKSLKQEMNNFSFSSAQIS